MEILLLATPNQDVKCRTVLVSRNKDIIGGGTGGGGGGGGGGGSVLTITPQATSEKS